MSAPLPIVAAQRDRSFYAFRSSGSRGKWHLLAKDGMSPRCGGVPLLERGNVLPAERVPAVLRCRRCTGWPA